MGKSLILRYTPVLKAREVTPRICCRFSLKNRFRDPMTVGNFALIAHRLVGLQTL